MDAPKVLYRDGLMLIVDKPAGIAVHAGPSGGPSLEESFDDLRFGLPRPPALAHRLDRDTSGCLILGRHPKALRRLGKLFSANRVAKTYWAIVRGQPAHPSGRIDFSLKKVSTKAKGWRMVADPEGQDAVTTYRTLGTGRGLSWLALSPKTGRTHQIRVHCAQSGFPILGDPWYGSADDRTGSAPLHLHARAIEVPLYPKKDPVKAYAAVPDAIRAAFEACGFKSDSDQIEQMTSDTVP